MYRTRGFQKRSGASQNSEYTCLPEPDDLDDDVDGEGDDVN